MSFGPIGDLLGTRAGGQDDVSSHANSLKLWRALLWTNLSQVFLYLGSRYLAIRMIRLKPRRKPRRKSSAKVGVACILHFLLVESI